jgi:hypothetical protein
MNTLKKKNDLKIRYKAAKERINISLEIIFSSPAPNAEKFHIRTRSDR